MQELTALELAVKASFKELVTECDGVTEAAKIAKAQPSHISEMASPNWPRMPRADYIRRMELHLGRPIFTTRQADALGYDVVQRESRSERGLSGHFTNIVKEIGDLQTRLAEAVARGDLTDEQATILDKEAVEAGDSIQSLRAELRAKRGLKVVGK